MVWNSFHACLNWFCKIFKKVPNVFVIEYSSTHMCYKSIYNNSKLTELHFKNNLEAWGYLWYMKIQSNYSSLCEEAMLCTEIFLKKGLLKIWIFTVDIWMKLQCSTLNFGSIFMLKKQVQIGTFLSFSNIFSSLKNPLIELGQKFRI